MDLSNEIRATLQRRLDEMEQARPGFVREVEANANIKIGRYDGSMAELRYILAASSPNGKLQPREAETPATLPAT